jgi:hypothetical protein
LNYTLAFALQLTGTDARVLHTTTVAAWAETRRLEIVHISCVKKKEDVRCGLLSFQLTGIYFKKRVIVSINAYILYCMALFDAVGHF